MPDTPLDRLNRMIALAPHGKEAVRLLQNLTVFQESFGRAAVTAMTPDDMSEAESIKAFATLRNWCLIQQISRRRYQIDDSLKQHFPPKIDLFAQAFDYFCDSDSVRDVAWVYFYWRDFSWMLLWGMGHRPAEVLALGPKVRPQVRQIAQAWPIYLDTIRKMAQQVSSSSGDDFAPALRGVASLIEDPLTAEDWYEQSLELYFQLDNPGDQATFLALRGLAARQKHDFALARHCYNQALTIYVRLGTRFKQTEISRTLFQLALQEEDLDTARGDMERYLGLVQALEQVRSLYLLGRLAHKLKNIPVARDVFARALSLTTPRMTEMSTQLLSDWILMEYELGNYAESCALYGLMVNDYHQAIDAKMSHDYSRWSEDLIERRLSRLGEWLAQLQALAARIGCEDV